MGNNQSNHFPHIPEKVTWSLNTIINGKSQTLLSDFFEDRGGCTQATLRVGRDNFNDAKVAAVFKGKKEGQGEIFGYIKS